MSDTVLQTSEVSVIPSDATVIPSAATVILSEAKDLSPSEAPTDLDTLELDLALEDELIIEDFTIDGICGVY
jgi:mycofactocin precursor